MQVGADVFDVSVQVCEMLAHLVYLSFKIVSRWCSLNTMAHGHTLNFPLA